ncbi:MAG: DUF4422 domain-containing protein [Methanobrevibacter sp.]|jgi:hypothetical protein|nr:DUF4422 domain-containing protein [Methanobrevibacter sp.]
MNDKNNSKEENKLFKDLKTKIYIIFHDEEKAKSLVKKDIYYPLYVGCHNKQLNPNLKNTPNICCDNTNNNISEKNPDFCELTGLYWMWKNSKADILGLCHYRRYFTKSTFGSYLDKEDIEQTLSNHDIILPKSFETYFGSLYKDFKYHHDIKYLNMTKNIIQDLYPNYANNFDKVMNKKKGYYYNMFIMKKNLVDDYCDWLFTILFELENRLNNNQNGNTISNTNSNSDIDSNTSFNGNTISNINSNSDIDSNTKNNDNDSRIYGFISERLFNLWIYQNNLKIKETNVKIIENWFKTKLFIKKIGRFLYFKLYKRC